METTNPETGEITVAPPPLRNANPLTRVRVAKLCTGPSLAKQSFKEECDINNIMRKFRKNGIIDHLNTHQGDYGNFIGFEDYQTSLNKIQEAKDAFSTLPADIRNKFDNSPQRFLAFVQNPDNLEKMQEMGLANKPPAKAATEDSTEAGTIEPAKPAPAAEAAPTAAKVPPGTETTS